MIHKSGTVSRSRFFIAAALAVLVLAWAAPEAWAQRTCNATAPRCPDQDVTVSTIQMGGEGSLSSNGSSFSNPGRLDDGTIAEADLIFTYDRTSGVLTVQAINQTASTASLTGFSFNTPPSVTGMSLTSHTGSLAWELGFDKDTTDNVVDSHPGGSLKILKMDGMGAFNVLIANNGIDTGPGGGNPAEILAGDDVTFTIQVTGDTANLSACDFTSLPSRIPPGDKITIAVARFQSGAQGGSGFISPCDPGDLLVRLASFSVEPGDGKAVIRWRTSAEVDNAGFAVLRKDERSGVFERITPGLIPGQGSPVSGADYGFVDEGALNGVKYLYMLEDFDLGGFNTIHPPRRAIPNPKSPPLRLLEPAYEAVAGQKVVLRWESSRRMPVSILISADPAFPPEGTMSLSSGAGNTRRLSPRERGQILDMTAAGATGVYWKVAGRSPRGGSVESQTWFLTVER